VTSVTVSVETGIYPDSLDTSDGKRHLPTLLRLVTDAISKFHRQARAVRTAISFAGFTSESANVYFIA